MPPSRPDDDGHTDHRAPVALLLVDVFNDLEFPGGERLLEPAMEAARRMRELRDRFHAAELPVVYANDNFGQWRSDVRQVLRHVLEDGVRGEPLARILEPGPDDHLVLKPRHSAFFQTTLDLLLRHVGARTLVLGGYSADICVLFTAMDAYMRSYGVHLPSDCVASESREEAEDALAWARRVLDADTRPAAELDLEALARR